MSWRARPHAEAGASRRARRRPWTPLERRWVMALLVGEGRRCAALGLLIVATTACVLSGPALIGAGVDAAVDPGGRTALFVCAGAFLAISIAGWLLTVVELRLFGRLTELFLARLRERAFAHLTGLSGAWFDATPSGTPITRLTADVEAIAIFFRTGLIPLVTNVFVLLATLVFMAALSLPLFLVVFVTVTPVAVGLFVGFLRRSRRDYDLARVRISESMGVLSEGVAGIAVVRAFGAEQRERDHFDAVNGAQVQALVDANRTGAQFAASVDLVGVLALVPVLVGGAWLYDGGYVSIGVVVAFVVYVSSIFDPVQQISQFLGQATAARSAFANVVGLLEVRDALAEPEAGAAAEAPAGGDVELRSVRFGYGGRPVLDRFDLRVPAGQRVALVGPSGAGKTTVAKLIARLADPEQGRVTLGGVDLRELTTERLRARVVLVSQHAHVFEGDVAANVRLGRPQASDEEVAATLATLVGEPAARALLRAPAAPAAPAAA
ncbi:ABC transporter ATP-binding protein, partial [Conexibacter stalactiti]